ncbi:unnamed protein product, partial [Arctogadus glacialis]
RQHLYKHSIHREARLDDAVHLLHLVQEEDYGTVHSSGRFHAAMPDYPSHSQPNVLHATRETGTNFDSMLPRELSELAIHHGVNARRRPAITPAGTTPHTKPLNPQKTSVNKITITSALSLNYNSLQTKINQD